MSKQNIEIVILMPGNTFTWDLVDQDQREAGEIIKEAMTRKIHGLVTLGDAGILRSDAITGFYFRRKQESSSERMLEVQKRVVDLMEREAKRGEDWRE